MNAGSIVAPSANSSDVSSQSTLPSLRAMKPSRLAAMWIVMREPASDMCRPIASAERCSAHRSLHERGDPRLVGRGEILQREGRRPHFALVEERLVAEAERCVSRLE